MRRSGSGGRWIAASSDDLIGRAAMVAALAIALAACSSSSDEPEDTGSAASPACPGEECITINTEEGAFVFTAEWAVDPAARSCGLMYRTEMAEDHGMVFDFQTERPASFWMRNTYISLDMVFIEEDGTVLNIATYTVPLSLEGVPSDGPVRYVLEVVAGTADRIGLEAGDFIDLERPPGVTEGTATCGTPPE